MERRDWYNSIGLSEESFDAYFENRSATGSSGRILDGLSPQGLNVVVSFEPNDPLMSSPDVRSDDCPVRYNGKVVCANLPIVEMSTPPEKPDAVFGLGGNLAATSSINRHVSDSLTLACKVSTANLGFAWRMSRLVKWASMLVADHRCFNCPDGVFVSRLQCMGLNPQEASWVAHFVCLGLASYSDPNLTQPCPRGLYFVRKGGKRW